MSWSSRKHQLLEC